MATLLPIRPAGRGAAEAWVRVGGQRGRTSAARPTAVKALLQRSSMHELLAVLQASHQFVVGTNAAISVATRNKLRLLHRIPGLSPVEVQDIACISAMLQQCSRVSCLHAVILTEDDHRGLVSFLSWLLSLQEPRYRRPFFGQQVAMRHPIYLLSFHAQEVRDPRDKATPQQLAKAYRLHSRAKVPSPAELAANVRTLLRAGELATANITLCATQQLERPRHSRRPGGGALSHEADCRLQ